MWVTNMAFGFQVLYVYHALQHNRRNEGETTSKNTNMTLLAVSFLFPSRKQRAMITFIYLCSSDAKRMLAMLTTRCSVQKQTEEETTRQL